MQFYIISANVFLDRGVSARSFPCFIDCQYPIAILVLKMVHSADVQKIQSWGPYSY